MAVLIEAISVIVRRDTIEEKYPGGLDQYIKDCPNRSLCMDGEIVRVGFMTPKDTYAFTENLELFGFRCVTDEQFDEIAVADHIGGFALPVEWLQLLDLKIFEGNQKFMVCKIKGSAIGDVAFPVGWNYETSLSKHSLSGDTESMESRLIFLRHEKGGDFYLDILTNEEMFIERTSRNANA